MERQEQVDAVQRMQEYILANLGQPLDMQALAAAAGYSLYYAVRLFRSVTGKRPTEYARGLALTQAARTLRDTDNKVIDVALDAAFESHDGFTRAFSRQFGLAPKAYQREKPAVRYFVHYPARHRLLLTENTRRPEMMKNQKVSTIVTVTAVERPARKAMILRSKDAKGYMSFCEECGCDWEGILNSVAEKFETAAIFDLPEELVKPGTSPVAAGIEVPEGYAKPLPEGMEMVALPACTMLMFQGMPYAHEEDFVEAIEIVAEAVAQYNPGMYGYTLATDTQPRMNFGSTAALGAKMALPVKKA